MKKKSIGAYALAVGAFLLAKFKWVIAGLKWTKFGGTLVTMGISLGVYAAAYGWKFGVALIYLIFVHEMGHVWAAKRKGMNVSPAFFIPFVGAFIAVKEQPKDARTEAFMAYCGPLAGLISFLPAIPLYVMTEEPFWALVIFLGAIINLFNLMPVSPLDGGRIISVLSTHIWLIGLLIMGAVLIISPSPILILLFIIGIGSWWNRARESYHHDLLAHERKVLREFRSELAMWPALMSTAERKALLQNKLRFLEELVSRRRGWYIPFLQDKVKLQQEQARIELHAVRAAYELLNRWEYMPVLYEDGDPSRPLASTLLEHADRDAADRLNEVGDALQRLQGYYQAPASTKWKVLAAYLGLMVVLAAFAWYGHGLMELHQLKLR